MCGIVGIRAETLQKTGGDFAAALRALAWRGRDGSGTALVGGWQVGVARLAISDPQAGQPITCPDTGRVVVFNGAVTSAPAEWQRYGAGRQTRNDAELPLLRLRHRGPAELAPRCGHHALAVIEPSGAGWLARDAFGEKPLYCVQEGERVVAFASTVAALRALGLSVELPVGEVAHFFRAGWHGAPVVNAGRSLDDDHRGVWSVADGQPHAQAIEAWPARPLRARVQAAIERCATAEVPVGLSLSGGLDSACLAAGLGAARRTDVVAFQFRAKDAPSSERTAAEAGAQMHGLRLVPVDADASILGQLTALTRAHGLPVGDPSTLAAHAVAQAAAAHGVKVLLSGEGGDEMFFSYRRHRAAAAMRSIGALPWQWLPEPDALAQGYVARLRRALRRRDVGSLYAVAPPGVAATALVPELREAPARETPRGDPLLRMLALDRDEYLRRDLLVKLDLATLHAGVEGRCPFLDPEVCAAPEADPAVAARNLGKRALRRAFAAELPRQVLRQRKTGFALPLDRWLRCDDYLPDLLNDRRTLERGHLVKDGVRKLLDLHRAGDHDLGHALYLFAAYEIYLRVREELPCHA